MDPPPSRSVLVALQYLHFYRCRQLNCCCILPLLNIWAYKEHWADAHALPFRHKHTPTHEWSPSFPLKELTSRMDSHPFFPLHSSWMHYVSPLSLSASTSHTPLPFTPTTNHIPRIPPACVADWLGGIPHVGSSRGDTHREGETFLAHTLPIPPSLSHSFPSVSVFTLRVGWWMKEQQSAMRSGVLHLAGLSVHLLCIARPPCPLCALCPPYSAQGYGHTSSLADDC